jgi:hypothetical protein
MNSLGLYFAVLLLPTAASAQPVVDQQQPIFGSAMASAIGGPDDQKLAQTVTAGLDGSLTHVELPVACDGGRLIVEIVRLEGRLPGTRVLATGSLESALVPPEPSVPPFVRIALSKPVRMSRGDRFAIVMRNETGSCGIPLLVHLDWYPGGQAFHDAFDARRRRRVWTPTRFLAVQPDFPFRTIVEAAPPRTGSIR